MTFYLRIKIICMNFAFFNRCSGNMTFGPVQKQSFRLIGDMPKTQVDMSHIYCISCQTFIGSIMFPVFFLFFLFYKKKKKDFKNYKQGRYFSLFF